MVERKSSVFPEDSKCGSLDFGEQGVTRCAVNTLGGAWIVDCHLLGMFVARCEKTGRSGEQRDAQLIVLNSVNTSAQ